LIYINELIKINVVNVVGSGSEAAGLFCTQSVDIKGDIGAH
jgi:hypothetical protein